MSESPQIQVVLILEVLFLTLTSLLKNPLARRKKEATVHRLASKLYSSTLVYCSHKEDASIVS
jgi:hypothetical protein